MTLTPVLPRFGAHSPFMKEVFDAAAPHQWGEPWKRPTDLRPDEFRFVDERRGSPDDYRVPNVTPLIDTLFGEDVSARLDAAADLETMVRGDRHFTSTDAAYTLAKIRDIMGYKQNQGDDARDSFYMNTAVNVLLDKAEEFKNVQGRDWLHIVPKGFEYKGPVFKNPEQEKRWLTLTLHNQDDRGEFAVSVAESSDENFELALKEARFIDTPLLLGMMNKLAESDDDKRDAKIETLATRLIDQMKERNGSNDIALAQEAFGTLVALRQYQHPARRGNLVEQLFTLAKSDKTFLQAGNLSYSETSKGAIQRLTAADYTRGHDFGGREERYLTLLAGKTTSFDLLAQLMGYALEYEKKDIEPGPGGCVRSIAAHYTASQQIAQRIQQLVEELPTRDLGKKLMATQIFQKVSGIERQFRELAIEAYTALGKIDAEVPEHLSIWLLRHIMPDVKITQGHPSSIPGKLDRVFSMEGSELLFEVKRSQPEPETPAEDPTTRAIHDAE